MVREREREKEFESFNFLLSMQVLYIFLFSGQLTEANIVWATGAAIGPATHRYVRTCTRLFAGANVSPMRGVFLSDSDDVGIP